MASHLTGWAPNPPLLYHAAATSVNGAVWRNTTTPASGDGANITYNSQSTFVFSLTFEDGTVMYIYMGDRWNFYGPGKVSHSLFTYAACLMPVLRYLQCQFLLTASTEHEGASQPPFYCLRLRRSALVDAALCSKM